MPSIKTMEKKVISALIDSGLRAGYEITVYDGKEKTVIRSKNKEEMLKALWACDHEWLRFFDPTLPIGKQYVGNVFLIYGECGWDVINDYSVSLEPIMAPVNAVIDRLQEAV